VQLLALYTDPESHSAQTIRRALVVLRSVIH